MPDLTLHTLAEVDRLIADLRRARRLSLRNGCQDCVKVGTVVIQIHLRREQ